MFSRMGKKTCYFREQEKTYVSPATRIIPITTEYPFLQSNLEPIGGGDDPDIDW